jgi:hypothetical protein
MEEFLTGLGQLIFGSLATRPIEPHFYHTGSLQLSQSAREKCSGNSRQTTFQTTFQTIEVLGSCEHIPNDQQCPAIPQDV